MGEQARHGGMTQSTAPGSRSQTQGSRAWRTGLAGSSPRPLREPQTGWFRLGVVRIGYGTRTHKRPGSPNVLQVPKFWPHRTG
jgi:hypothetical protein